MSTQGFTVSGSSLSLLKVGEQGVVVSIRGRDLTTLNKLRAMGVQPGTTLCLERKTPNSRVHIRIGDNYLVLTQATANAVYVRLATETLLQRSQNAMGVIGLVTAFWRWLTATPTVQPQMNSSSPSVFR